MSLRLQHGVRNVRSAQLLSSRNSLKHYLEEGWNFDPGTIANWIWGKGEKRPLEPLQYSVATETPEDCFRSKTPKELTSILLFTLPLVKTSHAAECLKLVEQLLLSALTLKKS
jgi:hypothetical protein